MIEEQALILRRKCLEKEMGEILKDEGFIKRAVLQSARARVARRYKDIAKELGSNIIWGEGGYQTKKEYEYKKAGIPYTKIPSHA